MRRKRVLHCCKSKGDWLLTTVTAYLIFDHAYFWQLQISLLLWETGPPRLPTLRSFWWLYPLGYHKCYDRGTHCREGVRVQGKGCSRGCAKLQGLGSPSPGRHAWKKGHIHSFIQCLVCPPCAEYSLHARSAATVNPLGHTGPSLWLIPHEKRSPGIAKASSWIQCLAQ